MKSKWHNISIKKESFEELQKIQESAPVKISLSQTIDWLISVGQAQIKSELRKTINVNEL
jgi:hypothetical protein|tara:strand:- start:6853 stop:7032 length:180 start_codon:yes stop_codon:yes gene_type:complete